MATTKAVSRVSDAELAPVVDHIAKASHYSQEAFLELSMALEHIRRVMPEDFDTVAALLHVVYQSWQTVEECADEVLGSQIVLTGKELPRIEA